MSPNVFAEYAPIAPRSSLAVNWSEIEQRARQYGRVADRLADHLHTNPDALHEIGFWTDDARDLALFCSGLRVIAATFHRLATDDLVAFAYPLYPSNSATDEPDDLTYFSGDEDKPTDGPPWTDDEDEPKPAATQPFICNFQSFDELLSILGWSRKDIVANRARSDARRQEAAE